MLCGLVVAAYGAGYYQFVEAPDSVVAWVAEGIWIVGILLVLTALVLGVTAFLRKFDLLTVRILLVLAVVAAFSLAILYGYSPPLFSVIGITAILLYFAPLTIAFVVAAIGWWIIAGGASDA
jgi:hypothetical protein